MKEKVLHSFTGGSDGAVPVNMILTDLNGVLYGVTEQGGGSGCLSGNGCGTFFKLSTSGAESVLYSFKGKPDGQNAKGGVVERSGVLYGTTQSGGKYGGGAFFKITTSGKETVLHSFGNPGYYGPYARVIYVAANDMFYGTTLDGGTGTCGTSGLGCGTVFSVTQPAKKPCFTASRGVRTAISRRGACSTATASFMARRNSAAVAAALCAAAATPDAGRSSA
jgi:uncharacterized repeat protein (TIGR03803 family)